nr:hypothetical protein [Tanacetum cinerariifolium]
MTQVPHMSWSWYLHDYVEPMAWQTDYCIMKEGMSILGGRKSVPGISSSEKENGKKGTCGMAIDYCILKEEMSIIRGRKSVPGISSSERENGKK